MVPFANQGIVFPPEAIAATVPICLDHTPLTTEPMKKVDINLNERFGIHAYLTVKRYTYVSRLARLSRHGSMQKTLESFFPQNWESENSKLAEKCRKMGFRESEFYPPGLLKRMGIKSKPGRRGSMTAA